MGRVLILFSLNHLAKCFPRIHLFRLLGIYAYIESPIEDVKIKNQKLLFESFFDMGMGVLLNILAFTYHGNFSEFFTGTANIVNSVLTITYATMMPPFVFYSHCLVHTLYDDLGKK